MVKLWKPVISSPKGIVLQAPKETESVALQLYKQRTGAFAWKLMMVSSTLNPACCRFHYKLVPALLCKSFDVIVCSLWRGDKGQQREVSECEHTHSALLRALLILATELLRSIQKTVAFSLFAASTLR